MDKNPFLAMGLNPEAINGLTDQQIEMIISMLHKAWQQIYHPDKSGGSTGKSQFFNQLKDQLDYKKNPEQYALYKQEFLKKIPKGKKKIDWESKLKSAQDQNNQLALAFLEYLKALLLPPSGLTVFNLQPCVIRLHDYARDSNAREYVHGLNIPKGKNPSFFEIIINPDLTLTEKRVGKEKIFSQKKLIGTIYPKTLNQDKITMRSFLQKIQNAWTPINQDNAEKGIIRTSSRLIKYLEPKIPAGEFLYLLPYLKPNLVKDAYLFSVNNEGRQLIFSLEGTIKDIDILKTE
jgi:hypothetical protein